MNDDFFDAVYNPDVLSCIANLSSDEVFTPPGIANDVLDMLPQELFQSRDTTFLDPGSKSGIFLREIAKRLLRAQIPGYERIAREIRQKQREGGTLDPDEESFLEVLQENIDHIFHNQIFGIATTELTSLLSRRSVYCSKFPNSDFSICHFDSVEGNIRFRRTPHSWDKNGNCIYCGASKKIYDRGDLLETHAYEFIHTNKPEDIFSMKFDVIVSNPPYQLSDGSGLGAGAIPIYDRFVSMGKKLNPRYMTMIIPARWFGGGRGLDKFREEMISDTRIRILHDFLDASDCFSGVEIKGGICYFLWDRDNPGKCRVVTHIGKELIEQEPRELKEDNSDVFIRYAEGVSIYHKVRAWNEPSMERSVSSQRPFGLRTYVHGKEQPFNGALKLFERGGIGYIERNSISQHREWIDKAKVFISAAYNAGDTYPHQIIGKPLIGCPGSVCTETYVVIGPYNTTREAENLISYIKTKFFRFLVMLKKVSQHAAANVYSFVPMQDFSKPWTDAELYEKYGLTDKEIKFIESMIKPMETADD